MLGGEGLASQTDVIHEFSKKLLQHKEDVKALEGRQQCGVSGDNTQRQFQ